MQEQDHSLQEKQRTERQTKTADGIHSFHEVVYPPREVNRLLQYFIGVAIGCIPLMLFLLLTSPLLHINSFSGPFGIAALACYLALWGAAVVCLGIVPRVRFVGYGLLTMAIFSPFIWIISWRIPF